jgi:tetratricopeptide (TPR) repeat protein
MDSLKFSQLCKYVLKSNMNYLLSLILVCCFLTGGFAQENRRGGYDFHLSLAYGYYDQQEYAKAIESIKDALRTKRNKPHIYVLRAKIHLARNGNLEAIADLNRASRLGSEEADKMLAELGAKSPRAMSQKEVEAFENDLNEYLKKQEAKKEPKLKKDKKTKTRK